MLTSKVKFKLLYEFDLIILKIFGFIFGFRPNRSKLAWRFISGSGIEIGALNIPLPVSGLAKVKYVDIETKEQNEINFPHLKGKLVTPEIIDNGFLLSCVESKSQSFLIANHVLEHSNNPIQTLVNWARVLKIGGILFVSVPLAPHCFDRGRSITTLQHMIEDFDIGSVNPQALIQRNKEHYREWFLISEPNILFKPKGLARNIPEQDLVRKVDLSVSRNDEIHFHTFTRQSFADLLRHFCDSYGYEFEILAICGYVYETIGVLKRIH
jgi:SAM-dependent methyltransferase